MKTENHLTLKWGTLKAWNFSGLHEAQALLEQYDELGRSMSAIMQHDTPEQKEIICKIIDLMPGKIYLAWDSKYVSKSEAKRYVLEYGKEV
jgi:DNA-directed RNA polymerase subunit F